MTSDPRGVVMMQVEVYIMLYYNNIIICKHYHQNFKQQIFTFLNVL